MPRARLELRRARLGEPDAAGVVAEVRLVQVGIAVEAEIPPDGPLERAREVVRQQVGARLVSKQLLDGRRACEEVIAMQSRQARKVVERAGRAAVGVADHVALLPDLVDRRPDALGPVVELRRQADDLEVEASPLGDRAQVHRQRAARDNSPTGHRS